MSLKKSPGLLVSVRSPEEADAALSGGASLIDVKEPNHGSLGRADDDTIRAVLQRVAGRCPVSAAMGELAENASPMRETSLAFSKWGLAGCRGDGWKAHLRCKLAPGARPQTVVVAYADWQCAQAPALDDAVAFACERPGNVLLVDTHCKEAGMLLDWVSGDDIHTICERCRAASVRVALAGSLRLSAIEALRDAGPDWFAVRGAVCDDGERRATIDAARVREIVDCLRSV